MNNLSAAVGCAQLENLTKIISAKRNNFKYLKLLKNFNDVEIMREPNFAKSNYWLVILKCKNLKLKIYLIKKFKEKKLELDLLGGLTSAKIFKNCPKIT